MVPIAEPRCAPALLDEAAQRFGQRIALEHEGKKRTYARLAADVSRFAQGLHDLGVRRGHRVAIVSDMHAEAATAFHATLRIGAIAVMLDPTSTPRELRRSFEDHSAILAIADRAIIPRMLDLPADLRPKALIAIDPPLTTGAMVRGALERSRGLIIRAALQRTAARLRERVIPFRIVAASSPLPPDHPQPEAQDLATLLYTSAADGTPLGAMLTHENLVSNAIQLQRFWHEGDLPCDGSPESPPCSVCTTVPLHETVGASLVLIAPLLLGQSLMLAPTPEAVLEAVRRGPSTFLLGTAWMLARVADLAEVRGRRRPVAEHALTFPMGLTDTVAQRCRDRLGGPLSVAYARAECGVSLAGPFDGTEPTGVGRPVTGAEITVDDEGELSIRGPQIFHGYWNRPDETADVLTGDGWFMTGDTGQEASEGVRVTLERGTVLTAEGRAVSPQEVAATFMGHPDVIAAAVFGAPAPQGGDDVHARIVLRPEATADAAAIRAFASARLSPSKVPLVIDLISAPDPGSDPRELPSTAGSPGHRQAPATAPSTE